jgi:signal transduction histidine kinase
MSGSVSAHDRLLLAVGELLENAATHAGDAPTVAVTVSATETTGTVTVADDGLGFPSNRFEYSNAVRRINSNTARKSVCGSSRGSSTPVKGDCP